MLTVVIETRNHEEALARTLASLVGGAVEGIVRDVIICDGGSTDQTGYVAEHAGCNFVADGGIANGIRQSKGDWVLLLEPGARLVDGWTDAVVAYCTREATPACFSPAPDRKTPFWKRIFARRTGLSRGLLIPRREASRLSAGANVSAETIARSIRARRLDAEIVVATIRA